MRGLQKRTLEYEWIDKNMASHHGNSIVLYVGVCYFNASVQRVLFNTLHKIKETPPKVVGVLRATAHVAANSESSGLGNVNINIKTRNDILPLAPEEVWLCDSNPPDSTAARRETRSTRRLSSSRICLSVTTDFRANWSFPKKASVGYPKAVL